MKRKKGLIGNPLRQLTNDQPKKRKWGWNLLIGRARDIDEGFDVRNPRARFRHFYSRERRVFRCGAKKPRVLEFKLLFMGLGGLLGLN